jgi:predicted membrane-bound mannosyltransferase
MKDPVARFWAVEHITTMLGAVIAAHVGRVLARKTADPNARRMKLFICYGIATLLMFIAVPWPGMRAGRRLFPGLGF